MTVATDLLLALAALAFARYGCCGALAWCLSLKSVRRRPWARALCGAAVVLVMLAVTPLIYATRTQPLAIGVCWWCWSAACSILELVAARQDPEAKPLKLRELLHTLDARNAYGVLKCHRRKMAKQQEQQQQQQQQQEQQQLAGSLSPAAQAGAGAPAAPHRAAALRAVLVLLRVTARVNVALGIMESCFAWGEGLASAPSPLGPHPTQPGGAARTLSAAVRAALGPVASRHLCCLVAGLAFADVMGESYCAARALVLLFGSGSARAAAADDWPEEVFDAPLKATSMCELWSSRWHQVLRAGFEGVGYGVADAALAVLHRVLAPPKGAAKVLRLAVRSLAVFVMSGLLHEYVCFVVFGILDGKQMAFFLLHWAATLAEAVAVRCSPVAAPVWAKRLWTIGFFAATSPLFVDPYLRHGVLQNRLAPFGGANLTSRALQWAFVR